MYVIKHSGTVRPCVMLGLHFCILGHRVKRGKTGWFCLRINCNFRESGQ